MISFLKYSIASVVIACSAMLSSAAPVPVSACHTIKRNTYVFFNVGKFNDSAKAAYSGVITFAPGSDAVGVPFVPATDAAGKPYFGLMRVFYYDDPPSPTNVSCTTKPDGTATCGNAGQQLINASCGDSKNSNAGTLCFTSSGGDAHCKTFTVYAGGSKLWVATKECERDTSGKCKPDKWAIDVQGWWYIQQPPPSK